MAHRAYTHKITFILNYFQSQIVICWKVYNIKSSVARLLCSSAYKIRTITRIRIINVNIYTC